MNSWTRRPAFGAAVAGALALGTLAGCSSSSNASSVSGGSGDVTLVVYSSQGYDSAVTKAFTKATGIPVSLDDDSTGPLLAKVGAERNNPQWGLLWVDGDTAFATLDKEGQLLDYNPGVTLTSAGETLVPSDHAYSPVSTTAVPALIYNAAKVTAVPKTWQDLLGAAYKDKVGMNDPSQSGPTYPLIAGLMNELGGESGGVAAGEKYLSELKANGLQVHPTNGDTLHALETGQIDYGLIQSSAAAGEVATAKKSANYDPKVVYLGTTTLLPGVIGIDKGASAKVQQEAEKFVQYVLSAAGQAVMQTGDPTGDSLYWPIVPGIEPVKDIGTMPATYQRIDPSYWGPLETQVNTYFDENIK
ncbi:extracellular solute-binding protein [Actinospica sp. MGRD01-02]|uniref:Extracellular solute-binding protein n=1 Tax=Actinospica acidithermotolerans TaxID=2828514 RepID=A0A941E471_9ACTN|nr:extracellular solute-binding protein [Actinospica acidithermotolerans]MBR7825890.1 extracellular solute-binding protein [Actinospica acidithermotolerans]